MLIYAILAGGAWLFFSGALVFAVILPAWFQSQFGEIIRDPKKLPLWAVALEKILQSLGLCLLVLWTNLSIALLCIVPILLVSATYLFSTYANYRVKGKAVVIVAVLDAVRIAVAMVFVGLILGRNLV